MQLLGDFDNVVSAVPLALFDDSVLEFFGDLSKRLMRVHDYSDLATFGFWCRKAALLKEKANYPDLGSRIGRGVVFHSTPSNVPVNFAYSFAAGLLAGNANIVRLPGREFEQVAIFIEAVRELISGRHASLAPYVCFVRYPPDRNLHDKYSSACDVRVIWGGDGTIGELRQSMLKPRATELTFADRYSIAVINADEYIRAMDKAKIAQDFYNDTYFSDQNACTAPRIVFWIGAQKEDAKNLFWGSVRDLAKERYELAPVQSVGKLAAFYKAAASVPATLADSSDWYVTRVGVGDADGELMRFKYNSGFFFEHDIDALEDMLPICGERMQTLTYYGFTREEMSAFVMEHKPRGIDRVVPMGKSMNFSLVWDGYDLIRQLSRRVTVL